MDLFFLPSPDTKNDSQSHSRSQTESKSKTIKNGKMFTFIMFKMTYLLISKMERKKKKPETLYGAKVGPEVLEFRNKEN